MGKGSECATAKLRSFFLLLKRTFLAWRTKGFFSLLPFFPSSPHFLSPKKGGSKIAKIRNRIKWSKGREMNGCVALFPFSFLFIFLFLFFHIVKVESGGKKGKMTAKQRIPMFLKEISNSRNKRWKHKQTIQPPTKRLLLCHHKALYIAVKIVFQQPSFPPNKDGPTHPKKKIDLGSNVRSIKNPRFSKKHKNLSPLHFSNRILVPLFFPSSYVRETSLFLLTAK